MLAMSDAIPSGFQPTAPDMSHIGDLLNEKPKSKKSFFTSFWEKQFL